MPPEYQGPALTLARLIEEIRGNTVLGEAIVQQNYPHIDSPADE